MKTKCVGQKIVVKAKCPRCKKRKQYTNEKMLDYTPHCPDCHIPLFIDSVSITKL